MADRENMKIRIPKSKPRNPFAQELRSPKYSQRVERQKRQCHPKYPTSDIFQALEEYDDEDLE